MEKIITTSKKHQDTLFNVMDALRGSYRASGTYLYELSLALSLYGLKAISQSNSIHPKLAPQASKVWGKYRASQDSFDSSYDLTKALVDFAKPFAQLERLSAQDVLKGDHEIRNETLARAALSLDKLSFPDEPELLRSLLKGVITQLLSITADSEGKLGLAYSTPPKVAELMARAALDKTTDVSSVYDPLCGVGNNLVAVRDALQERGADVDSVEFYGQDVNHDALFVATWNLLLNGIDVENISLRAGDTLRSPQFTVSDDQGERVREFDLVVSHPPFNLRGPDDLKAEDPYGRFRYGEIRGSGRDFAFLQHALASVTQKGRLVTLVSPGMLSRSGFEAAIRENLVFTDVVSAVVMLPSNLLPATTINTALLILDRAKPDSEKGTVLFADVSEWPKPQNAIEEAGISTSDWAAAISDLLKKPRQDSETEACLDIQGFAKVVPKTEVGAQETSLVPTLFITLPEPEHESIESLNQKIAEHEKAMQQAKEDLEDAIQALLA